MTGILFKRFILDHMDQVNQASRDHKTYLQELVQRKSGQVLTYQLVGASGPDHNKTFIMRVLLNGDALGQGSGTAKKRRNRQPPTLPFSAWSMQNS